MNNQLSSFWRRAIKTKSKQTLVFDPGGSTGGLRACPFLGTWRPLLCGERFVRVLNVAGSFFVRRLTSEYHFPERSTTRTYCGRPLFSPQPGCFEYDMPSIDGTRLCELGE